MPDVGVLNLAIKDNSGDAAKGVRSLNSALGTLSTKAEAVNLSPVVSQLEAVKGAVNFGKSENSAVKNLGALANGLSKYIELTKGLSEKFKLNVKPITDIKKAVGEGLNLGTAGAQIEKIQKAVSTPWGDSSNAISTLESIRDVGITLKANDTPTTLSDMAKAMTEYAEAYSQLKNSQSSLGTMQQRLAEGVERAKENWESNGKRGLPLNLQYFGNKKGSKVSGGEQLSMQLDIPNETVKAVEEVKDSLIEVKDQIESGTIQAGVSDVANSATENFVQTKESIEVSTDALKEFMYVLNATTGTFERVRKENVILSPAQGAAAYEKWPQAVKDAVQAMIEARNETRRVGDAAALSSERLELLREKLQILRDELDKGETARGYKLNDKEINAYKIQINQLIEKIDILEKRRKETQAFSTGEDMVDEYTNHISLIELYTNKLESMKKALADDIDYNRLSAQQIADRAIRIKTISEKIEELITREKELYRVQNMQDTRTRFATNDIDALVQRLNTPIKLNWSKTIDEMYRVKQAAKDIEADMAFWNQALKNENDPMVQKMNELYEGMYRVKEAADETGTSLETIKESEKKVNESTFSLKKSFKNLEDHIYVLKKAHNLIKRFFGTIASRSIRYIIRTLSSAFREGVENVYNYSKAVGTSFAPAMDEAATSLQLMKNSIGAAFAPLLQSLIPVLKVVVDWLVQGVNWLNQFFALLNGQKTWTKAVPATTTAFGKQEKAAKGAAAAIKDLLADWDELNIIQSETTGGSGGLGTSAAEDYLNMFVEMDSFSDSAIEASGFIKDNMEDILKVAGEVGVAVLAWKVSTAFSGVIGTLGSVVAAGLTIKASWDMTELFDNQYMKTGEDGWLIADVLTNLFGATIAGTLVKGVLGTAGALITAGFELLVSGAISYGVALANEDGDRQKALQTVGLIKGAIGDILIGAGFYVATGSVAGGVVGAALGAPLFVITAIIETDIQTSKNAQKMVDDFFNSPVEGGISVSQLFDTLNKEFNRLSEPYKASINLFDSTSEYVKQIRDASSEIEKLNSVVTSDQMLTQDQAEAFKEAWQTVFEAFTNLNDTEWDTIFEGFNAAMAAENEELRELAKERRIIAIAQKKDMDETEAALIYRMNELTDKIAKNEASDEEKEEYKRKMEAFAIINDDTMNAFEDAVRKAGTIDFSDEGKGAESAMSFIQGVAEAQTNTVKEIDDGLAAQKAAIEGQKGRINDWLTAGIITKEQADEWKNNLESYGEVFEQTAKNRKDKIAEEVTNAYAMVLNTAKGHLAQFIKEDGTLDVEEASKYVENALYPILEAMQEAGFDYSQILADVFNFSDALYDAFKYGEGDLNSLVTFLISELGEMATSAGKKINLADPFMRNLFDLTDWDLGMVQKQDIAQKLVHAFGYDAAAEALKEYFDISDEEMELIINYKVNENNPYSGEVANDLYEFTKAIPGLSEFMTASEEQFNNLFGTLESASAYIEETFGETGQFPVVNDDAFKAGLDGTVAEAKNAVNEINEALGQINSIAPGGDVSGYTLEVDAMTGSTSWGKYGSAPSYDQDQNNEEDMASAVAKGMNESNTVTYEQAYEIITYLDRMLNKEVTIAVHPNSGWAVHHERSNAQFERVVGP